MIARFLVVALFVFCPGILFSQTYQGRAVYVSDGDTFHFVPEGKTEKMKIRVEGIDCPERTQDFGLDAKEYAMSCLLNKVVIVEVISKDRYGRYIAKVTFDNKLLSHELLQKGYAWHYKYYNQDPVLARAEAEARKSKSGLWAGNNPVAPWVYRKQ